MASIASVVTLGYGSWGSVNLLPTLGYGIGEPPPVVIGSIRIAAVESRPAIRIRDMVTPSITIQGFDATPDEIRIGGIEVIP